MNDLMSHNFHTSRMRLFLMRVTHHHIIMKKYFITWPQEDGKTIFFFSNLLIVLIKVYLNHELVILIRKRFLSVVTLKYRKSAVGEFYFENCFLQEKVFLFIILNSASNSGFSFCLVWILKNFSGKRLQHCNSSLHSGVIPP